MYNSKEELKTFKFWTPHTPRPPKKVLGKEFANYNMLQFEM